MMHSMNFGTHNIMTIARRSIGITPTRVVVITEADHVTELTACDILLHDSPELHALIATTVIVSQCLRLRQFCTNRIVTGPEAGDDQLCIALAAKSVSQRQHGSCDTIRNTVTHIDDHQVWQLGLAAELAQRIAELLGVTPQTP